MSQPGRLLALICAVSFTTLNTSGQNKKTVPARDTSKTVQLTAPAKPLPGPRPYKEVITDKAVTRKGLFTVHRIEDKWFFEIGDSLLNKDILIVNRISRAPIDTRAGFFGYAGDEINQNVVRFEKGPNKKLFMRNISYSVYARDTASPMFKAVMNSNIQPITASFDIKAYSPDSTGAVIDITDILNSDNELFYFSGQIKMALKIGALQSDKSYISDIRTYPINTEIKTVKTYARSAPPPVPGRPAAPASGFSTFELNSSMVLLPVNPMRPRYFDDRVSYFTAGFTDFDADPHGVKDISVVTRWRLEPKAEDMEKYKKGELVEPRKPIIYYIDPATPAKWVPYLMAGVNDWQKAFEKAGFKNAIMAKMAPTPEEDSTWSLEDARYSAIVYKPSEIPNAQGPHVHDPRTGEILESHINWFHNVMSLLHRWYLIQAAAIDPGARKPQFDDKLMGDLIRFVSSHEVGHTLGLPHNMGASSATPVEKLRDKKWVEEHGHTSSIMDYARFNYVAQPEDNISRTGIYPRIGDYDLWSIEWGYKLLPGKTEKEEKAILNEWVKARASNPRLRFLSANGIDPRAQTEDLGDNAMKASAYGIMNLKRILPQLPVWFNEKGENFDRLDKIYNELVGQYQRYMGHVATNLGGIYTDNKTFDQAGSVFTVVPRARQQEAMNFLQRNLFETPTWLNDKKVLNLISSPVSDKISQIQDAMLGSLLSSARMNRMVSSYVRDTRGYSLDEFMGDLRKGIFSELPARKAIDNYRRNLQKSYVERLIGLVNPATATGMTISLGPVFDPKKSDITSVAKASLRAVRQQITAALPAYTDNMSKYHLQDIGERIDKVFEKD